MEVGETAGPSAPVEEGPDEDQLGSQGLSEWQEFDEAQIPSLPDSTAERQKATPGSIVEWFRDWTTPAMRWSIFKLYRDIADVQEARIRVWIIIVTGL